MLDISSERSQLLLDFSRIEGLSGGRRRGGRPERTAHAARACATSVPRLAACRPYCTVPIEVRQTAGHVSRVRPSVTGGQGIRIREQDVRGMIALVMPMHDVPSSAHPLRVRLEDFPEPSALSGHEPQSRVIVLALKLREQLG